VNARSAAIDWRYARLYKPALFVACLLPALGCAGAVLHGAGVPWLPGFDAGADPVRFVLDRLAKTALNLLFLTLLVSPLRVLTGNAQLLRLRRMLGLFAFSYALLHFLVYLGPYQSFSVPEITKDIFKRPFTMAGFAALLLLVPLAATSNDRMMRRLRHRWQPLHRLIYPITALAVLHFWKMLKHEYREPLLYATLLVALLAFRALRAWRRRRLGTLTSRSALPTAPETGAGAAPWQDS
jgi:sulfoxide reductase heme-binding subunit YedZ